MFEKNKFIFIGAGVCLLAWWILYAMLVTPSWSQRTDEVNDAQDNLDRWAKYYKPAKGSLAYPGASKMLEDEQKLLMVSQKKLAKIEFVTGKDDVKQYDLQKYRGSDPMNFYDKKRTDLHADAQSNYGVRLSPGLADLGFRGKLTDDPVQLNLLRLFILRRFMETCKEAGIATVVRLDYPKVELLMVDENADEPSDMALIQVPLTVSLRAKERDFSQFLYELQRPTTEKRSYFCLRGYQVEVRDKASGEMDVQVALGALFPKPVYVDELKIPLKTGKRKSHGFSQPMPEPDRY